MNRLYILFIITLTFVHQVDGQENINQLKLGIYSSFLSSPSTQLNENLLTSQNYGFTSNYMISFGITKNKHKFNLAGGIGEVINSFNPIQNDPSFSHEAIQSFGKTHLRWSTISFNAKYSYIMMSKSKSQLAIIGSFQTNYIRFLWPKANNFKNQRSILLDDSQYEFNLDYFPTNNRDFNFQLISGLNYMVIINKKIHLYTELAMIMGLNNAASTRVGYSYSRVSGIGVTNGNNSVANSNSGIGVSIGIDYLL